MIWEPEINLMSGPYGIDDPSLARNLQEYKTQPPIALQYTGLKDKKGKEIYEGDIVKNHIGLEIVVYQAPEFVKKRSVSKKNWGTFILAETENQFDDVIGNIYENKDLLSGVEQ